jgi:hypothetical protein
MRPLGFVCERVSFQISEPITTLGMKVGQRPLPTYIFVL